MKIIFCPLLFFLFLFKTLAADPVPDDFSTRFKLLPQPQKVEMLSGGGIPYTSLKAINLQASAKRPVLYGLLKSLPLTASSGQGIITLTIKEDNSVPASPESYVLQVQNGQIN